MRRSAVLAAAAAATLVLAGCAGDDAPEPAEETAAEETAAEATPAGTELPTVEGDFGEAPEIQFPGSGAPEDLQVEVLQEGDGAEVGADDFVVADYHGQVWDGDVFDSSFERGAPTGFSLNQVIPGWKQGLTGTNVGDRVLLSIPPDLGYGEQGTPDGGVSPGDTLVFVVDVVGAYPPDATGDAEAEPVEPEPELPVEVEGGLGEPASISVQEGAEEPEEATATVLATGSGPEVPAEEGTTVVVQLAQTLWDNSQQASSWDETGVTAFTMGGSSVFAELAGIPVGSRVVLQEPATEQYGATATVLDIIDAVPAD